MKTLLLAACVLTLTGCGTTLKDRVVEVDRPIAINCIQQKPVRPDYATEHLGPNSTDLEYGDALAHDWPLSRVYEKKMEAAVNACLK